MGVDLLDHTRRRVGTEILDVQTVLPLAVDGFDLPAAMVEVDEFTAQMSLRIEE